MDKEPVADTTTLSADGAKIAAFEQNHASFRSLNNQMWQIPLISMTLTGGLWFGVAGASNSPAFQVALLLLACAGNVALAIIIVRLRFVMDQHLKWLEKNHPDGFVSAKGTHWYDRPFVVRSSFQSILLLAAAASAILLFFTVQRTDWAQIMVSSKDDTALTFYEAHAVNLADTYESVPRSLAHPAVSLYLNRLPSNAQLRVLDVGAGSGRDAAWFSSLGHSVIAVEPSSAMRRIARSIHPDDGIIWRSDSLPELDTLMAEQQRYDLILLSAVWMHVLPQDRPEALRNLVSLLEPNGIIFVTLRLGPSDTERGLYAVTSEEIERLLAPTGFVLETFDERPDLLGRTNISWVTLSIKAP